MGFHLKRSGIMLAHPFEERRLLNQGRFQTSWRPPYIVQPKLDGDRCRAIKEGSRCLLLSSTEEVISAVPHINDAVIKQLPDGEYDGELYVHGWTFSQINSVVSRDVNIHPDYQQMEYHIFDVINTCFQFDRLKTVLGLAVAGPLKLVPVKIAKNLDEIYDLYSMFIDLGYEGFIIREFMSEYVRKRSGHMMKFKPKAQDIYTITGVYEAISESGEPKGMVGGFNCVDDMGTTFNVAAGQLTHDQRIQLWKHYKDEPSFFIGKGLNTEYQALNEYKVPRHGRATRHNPTLFQIATQLR